MRRAVHLLLAALLLLPGAGAAAAEQPGILQLPPGTLTSEEVFTLFNNKTVYSVTAVQQRKSISYYAPSGEIRQLSGGIMRTGRWRVAEAGRICLQMEDRPEKCRIIVKQDGEYRKYIIRKNGRHQHSVSYPKFLDGNPLGL